MKAWVKAPAICLNWISWPLPTLAWSSPDHQRWRSPTIPNDHERSPTLLNAPNALQCPQCPVNAASTLPSATQRFIMLRNDPQRSRTFSDSPDPSQFSPALPDAPRRPSPPSYRFPSSLTPSQRSLRLPDAPRPLRFSQSLHNPLRLFPNFNPSSPPPSPSRIFTHFQSHSN